VREILEYDTVTKVPTTPPSIRGVINLRGSVGARGGSRGQARTARERGDQTELRGGGGDGLRGRADGDGPARGPVTRSSTCPRPRSSRPRLRDARSASSLSGWDGQGKKFVLLLDIDRPLHGRRREAPRPRWMVAPEGPHGFKLDASHDFTYQCGAPHHRQRTRTPRPQ
jgi:purine-binding chemotaxis protein CheW